MENTLMNRTFNFTFTTIRHKHSKAANRCSCLTNPPKENVIIDVALRTAKGGFAQFWDFFHNISLRTQRLQTLIALVLEDFRV